MLELRAKILQRIRGYFAELGFLEIETPLLSADTVVDLHLDPVPVTLADDVTSPHLGRPMWLQTSPEFCMKRLLAAYPRPIFQIAKAFRLGESGNFHNPEFTIVEWYRPGDDDAAGRKLLSGLCEHVLDSPSAQELTYRDAFQNQLNLDPHTASVAGLAKAAKQTGGLEGLVDLDRDGWLDALFVQCIQPTLGRERPTILHDYPASQAALAQTRLAEDGVTEVAARFELFISGVELANGYHELRDANVLRARMNSTNDQRTAAGKPRLPEDNRLLDAMEAGLPACSGCALGLDRLVMVAAGAEQIAEVLPFPIDRA